MLQIRKRDSLGGGNFGWLKARHHFKVTPDGNGAHTAIGTLVIWNDDEIEPGTGFDLHGHRDLEDSDGVAIIAETTVDIIAAENSEVVLVGIGPKALQNIPLISIWDGFYLPPSLHGTKPLGNRAAIRTSKA